MQIKQLEVAPGGPEDSDGIPAFLQKAMSPPSERAIWNALDLLVDLGAMNPDSNELTPLGDCLSVLTVDPRVGKMLIWSYLLGCTRVASNMACGMSSKPPFVMPHPAERFDAQDSMVKFSQSSESDPITIHHVLDRLKDNDWGKCSGFYDFCRSNYLRISSMRTISDSRRSLERDLKSLGFPSPLAPDSYQNRHDEDDGLWKAALAAGLYPNVAFRKNGETHFSTMARNKVKPLGSSVNAARGQPLNIKSTVQEDELELMLYGEIVKGDSSFTVRQTTYLPSPLPLLLLCGKSLTVQPDPSGNATMSILNLDDRIAYKCETEAAGHLLILRQRLDSAFWHAVSNRGLSTLTEEERDALEIVGSILQSAHQSAPIRSRDLSGQWGGFRRRR